MNEYEYDRLLLVLVTTAASLVVLSIPKTEGEYSIIRKEKADERRISPSQTRRGLYRELPCRCTASKPSVRHQECYTLE